MKSKIHEQLKEKLKIVSRKTLRFLCFGMALATFLTGCSDDDDNNNPGMIKPDLVFYGLTSTNGLVKYNANNASTAISTTAITGLQAGENLTAIDFRPATGQLYGLGSMNRIYMINTSTGLATAVSTTPFAASVAPMTGFDFNPTVDRIRIVTSTGVNLRVNPETGALTATDTSLTPGTPSIGSAAYTNNSSLSATTALYVMDFVSMKLNKIDSPNSGVISVVGDLGISGATGEGGFDIAAGSGIALANLTTGGMNHLYQINLSTGAATDLGMLSANIIGIAIPTAPIAFVADSSNNLHYIDLNAPGTSITKSISGLQLLETVVGIDMRPATGQLYAMTSAGRIYTISLSSGAATMVGAGPLAVSGTEFGFDFNPVPDRIRVVSNTGQNLRINPNDGTLAATDTPLNPGTPNVTAAAYTNSFAGATTTTLFDIDTTTDMLYIQNPPNNGTLTAVGALGVNATASNGFDIGGASNMAYAVLTVGGANGLYSINTTTGAATLIANFTGTTITGFAVGLGF